MSRIFGFIGYPERVGRVAGNHNSRKGNGHRRTEREKSKLLARLDIPPHLPWGPCVCLNEESNRIQEWDSRSPMRYWKRFSNRKVRNTTNVANHNGYRRIFDMDGLW